MTTPRRCPGIAYDLENEKRWIRVDLQDVGGDNVVVGVEKRSCGGCSIKSRYVSSIISARLFSRANAANCAMSADG